MILKEVSERIAQPEAEVVDWEERIIHGVNPFYELLVAISESSRIHL